MRLRAARRLRRRSSIGFVFKMRRETLADGCARAMQPCAALDSDFAAPLLLGAVLVSVTGLLGSALIYGMDHTFGIERSRVSSRENEGKTVSRRVENKHKIPVAFAGGHA